MPPTAVPREVVSAAVEPSVAAVVRERARRESRTVSNFLAVLIAGALNDNDTGAIGAAVQSSATKGPRRDES